MTEDGLEPNLLISKLDSGYYNALQIMYYFKLHIMCNTYICLGLQTDISTHTDMETWIYCNINHIPIEMFLLFSLATLAAADGKRPLERV